MQREGQSWIRIFPDKPITKKPADVRMGKGKGDPVGYVFPITPGRIIFEVEGVPFEVAKEALRLAAQKLPITTKFVEIRQIPQGELQERLASEVDKYGQLILTHSVSPLENSSQIKEARRTIARLKTFIRENELNNSK